MFTTKKYFLMMTLFTFGPLFFFLFRHVVLYCIVLYISVSLFHAAQFSQGRWGVPERLERKGRKAGN